MLNSRNFRGIGDFKMDEIFNMVDEMLGNPKRLTKTELDWVKKIDKTTARFRNIEFTPRQREVINEIYDRFKKRK